LDLFIFDKYYLKILTKHKTVALWTQVYQVINAKTEKYIFH